MKYVFDPAKDEANREKHGVSLALAEVLLAGPHISKADGRFDYVEVREVAFGVIKKTSFCLRLHGPELGAKGDRASKSQ